MLKAGRRAARFEVAADDWEWDCGCEGTRACCVCERVCTLVDDAVVVCVAVLADEAVEGAGLGFDLEGAWDSGRSGRSVVAAVRDVTVDFALECPR